jgi:mRNA interferase HigB
VNVIAPRTLRAFWEKHPQAEVALRQWQRVMQSGRYDSLSQIREVFPHADLAKSSDGSVVTIFNIGGNDFRLVAVVEYQWQAVFIKQVLTHAEYEGWNRAGRPI